jgi:hypothetical protein
MLLLLRPLAGREETVADPPIGGDVDEDAAARQKKG